MTIPSSRSLIFEVKSTGSELAFIRVLRLGLDNFAFGRLWTSSEIFGLLQKTSDFFRESSEMIVSFSKIPALSGQKSHAYISEKVGRYIMFNLLRAKMDRIKCNSQIISQSKIPVSFLLNIYAW